MPSVSLYLDVDGVVSPFGPLGRTDWGSEWMVADAGLLEVAYAVELVEELNVLASNPDTRFVWLTSWEELAPRFLCPAIGLNGQHWPVLTSEALINEGWDGQPEWWKLAALQRDIEASGAGRVVWMDDQLNYEPAARSWAEFLRYRMLWISPDPRRGLSRDHIASIKAFLSAVLP